MGSLAREFIDDSVGACDRGEAGGNVRDSAIDLRNKQAYIHDGQVH